MPFKFIIVLERTMMTDSFHCNQVPISCMLGSNLCLLLCNFTIEYTRVHQTAKNTQQPRAICVWKASSQFHPNDCLPLKVKSLSKKEGFVAIVLERLTQCLPLNVH